MLIQKISFLPSKTVGDRWHQVDLNLTLQFTGDFILEVVYFGNHA
jgi:hypothetical protein